MSLLIWIGMYLVCVLLCAWVVFWGGDEWMPWGFMTEMRMPYTYNFDPMGGEIIAWVVFIVVTAWFVIGLFLPDVRIFHPV